MLIEYIKKENITLARHKEDEDDKKEKNNLSWSKGIVCESKKFKSDTKYSHQNHLSSIEKSMLFKSKQFWSKEKISKIYEIDDIEKYDKATTNSLKSVKKTIDFSESN